MEITQPTLVLNKTVCLRNIELMSEKAKRHGLIFRPHFKTHQSIEVGNWFRNFGVEKITVSSVQMAHYFVKGGWNDITIAFPFNTLQHAQLNEIAALANINIVFDNHVGAEQLKNKLKNEVGVFIKITTGFKRVGIAHNAFSEIDRLLDTISLNPNFKFKGFITHAGHTYQSKSKNEVQNIHFDQLKKMEALKERYRNKYPDLVISTGDTPGCSVSEYFKGTDEIRPGNFVFYDLMQQQIGSCNIDDIAVRLHCPIISKQSYQNEIVIYGGAIHLSKDWITNIDGKPLYGRVVIRKNNEPILLNTNEYLCRLSQEHGVIKVSPNTFNAVEVGDIVEIIPVHSCLTAHAMGRYLTTKGAIISMMERF
jgi:D-serine deaminase-like pyridoxal phosphate-dependent protein